MLLSTIVTVFNKEKYLNKCISSILNQTLFDLEIIIIDDGSIDNSLDICRGFEKKDKRVRVIHQDNMGMCAARYKGLIESKGEYIHFVDADDWINENLYENFITQMKSHVDVIHFGKVVETDGSGSTEPQFNYAEGLYSNEKLNELRQIMIWDKRIHESALSHSLCDKIIKKDLILDVYENLKSKRNIEGLSLGEDAVILFPLMYKAQSIYINHICPYHYRKMLSFIPAYVSDENYYLKLFEWYSILKDFLPNEDNTKEQIEYLYMNMMKSRCEYWGDYVRNDEYIFPFADIPVSSSIILYGAGRVGCTYYDQLTRSNYAQNILWVDKNPPLDNKNVKSNSVIKSVIADYDYIVVAVQSKQIKKNILEWLKTQGVNEAKIY